MGEVRVWQSLSHRHLLPFLGVLFDDYVSLVSPFIDNGPLPAYLSKHEDSDRVRFVSNGTSSGRTDPDFARLSPGARAGFRAFAYLHGQGVVHGDLKGSNMLVSASVSILLCDFGLAKIVDIITSTSRAGMGTLRWQAPELMNGASKTPKSDVYAFGLTVYEVSGISRFHFTWRYCADHTFTPDPQWKSSFRSPYIGCAHRTRCLWKR